MNAYYFYLVDEEFGPAFIKVCAYFPYPVKIWVNGHEYAKRAARTMTGQTTYTTRQAAYDLRKLRGKTSSSNPAGPGYHLPPRPARVITALLTLREQVISPILAGIRSPRMGRKPAIWTRVDRDYENLRINMQSSSTTLASPRKLPPHRQLFVDRGPASA